MNPKAVSRKRIGAGFGLVTLIVILLLVCLPLLQLLRMPPISRISLQHSDGSIYTYEKHGCSKISFPNFDSRNSEYIFSSSGEVVGLVRSQDGLTISDQHNQVLFKTDNQVELSRILGYLQSKQASYLLADVDGEASFLSPDGKVCSTGLDASSVRLAGSDVTVASIKKSEGYSAGTM